jgi:hypothetical protein
MTILPCCINQHELPSGMPPFLIRVQGLCGDQARHQAQQNICDTWRVVPTSNYTHRIKRHFTSRDLIRHYAMDKFLNLLLFHWLLSPSQRLNNSLPPSQAASGPVKS